MRKMKLMLLFALAVLLLVAAGASAQGKQSVGHSEDDHSKNGDVDLAEDESLDAVAEILARSAGGTVEEAKAVLVHQDRVNQMQKRFHDRFPGLYGGAFSDGFADIQSTILVKGEITKEIQEVLGDLGSDVVLVRTKFSEAELREASTNAHQAMLDEGFTEVSSGYDVETGKIEIEVSSQDSISEDNLRTAAVESIRPIAPGEFTEAPTITGTRDSLVPIWRNRSWV